MTYKENKTPTLCVGVFSLDPKIWAGLGTGNAAFCIWNIVLLADASGKKHHSIGLKCRYQNPIYHFYYSIHKENLLWNSWYRLLV